MIVTKYTTEDFKRLPLRGIVAVAARCARRVAHLAVPPGEGPGAARCRAAIEQAIHLAENVANGLPCPDLESVVQEIEACRDVAEGNFVRESAMHAVVLAAHTAATALHALDLRSEPPESHLFGPAKPDPFPHLADLTADLTARDAFTAALTAADAVGHTDNFMNGIVDDYQHLLKLNLGSYPEAGRPIDARATGPLGPIETKEPVE